MSTSKSNESYSHVTPWLSYDVVYEMAMTNGRWPSPHDIFTRLIYTNKYDSFPYYMIALTLKFTPENKTIQPSSSVKVANRLFANIMGRSKIKRRGPDIHELTSHFNQDIDAISTVMHVSMQMSHLNVMSRTLYVYGIDAKKLREVGVAIKTTLQSKFQNTPLQISDIIFMTELHFNIFAPHRWPQSFLCITEFVFEYENIAHAKITIQEKEMSLMHALYEIIKLSLQLQDDSTMGSAIYTKCVLKVRIGTSINDAINIYAYVQSRIYDLNNRLGDPRYNPHIKFTSRMVYCPKRKKLR